MQCGGALEPFDMKQSRTSKKTDIDENSAKRRKREKNMVSWRETVESYLQRVRQRYRSNCHKDGSSASPEFLRRLAASIDEDRLPAKV